MSTLLSIATCKITKQQQHSDINFQKDYPIIEKHLPAKNLLNVSYGGDTAQKMDVYLPEGRSSSRTKVIILIHGGGWNAGNKTDLTYYINLFRNKLPEYAIFNLNYRLVSAVNKFPVQEEDIRTALNFIITSNKEYQINKDNIVLQCIISRGIH
jgi:acetyl esterase/lipase